MTDFLVRKFVKNSEDVKNKKVRENYGVFSGVVGIVCNLFLCAFKFVAGVLSSSISITADAFNNLSDAGSSLVSIIGFKMAGKPADKDHPFGHGRIEYIAGLIMSIVIILVGVELFQTSLDKILNPQTVGFSMLAIVIMCVSVLVKLWMSFFNKKLGKKINSGVMIATAKDSLNDSIATLVVIVSLVVNALTDFDIDGYMGILMSLFILFSGITTLRDMLNPLLGQPADIEMVQAIEKKVMSYDGIIGIHDLIVHNYGVGMSVISLHAEVPQNIDFLEIHEVIDIVERDVKEAFGGEVIIHMDPVANDDTSTMEAKKLVKTVVSLIDSQITMHDFRMVIGETKTNLIFDVLVPYNFRLSDEQVRAKIIDGVKSFDEKFELIINVDKPYV